MNPIQATSSIGLPGDSPVPLESVLCTEELNRRPARSPDYEKENRALAKLVQALADAPGTILQTLADTLLEMFQADSAGLSLLTTHDGGKRFYWPAIAGAWKPHVGGGTPREFGPCGDVLDRNAPLLFRHFERRYTYFLPVTPPVEECLLVPFFVGGKAVGTLWVIAHTVHRKFDAEDLRQLESLGRFASAAYQAVQLRQTDDVHLQQADDSRRAALNLMEDAVHARREAEQLNVELRESEQRYRNLFNSMDEGYCIIEVIFDPHEKPVDYRFLEVNPAFGKQAGMRDVTGKRMLEFVSNIEEHWLANYGKVALTGAPIRFANEYKGLDRWFDVYAFRVGGGGRTVAVLFTDITERVAMEKEIRQQAEQLAGESRRKDEFLAMLAHELRNPLAPIRSGLKILRRTASRGSHSPENEAVQSVPEMMERQVGQMVRLVDDLLDLNRISRGTIDLRREQVELASVVNHAVETARPHSENRAHELTVALPPEPIFVNGDAVRLAQAVGNLLNNACKFTSKGGRIGIALEREGEQAVIRVRDTGIGIAADQLPRVFEIYTQIDTSRWRSVGGLGIGLTLVKNLVELHGGTVEGHSAGVGQGSEFVVRLPILVEPAKAPPPEATLSEPTPTMARRILVVDDNRDAAESLAMLLKLSGNATHTAYDGLGAVEAAATFRPDVVLLDIGLPNLNGYEACRRIREQLWGRNMVLVALTGWGREEDREKSQEAGFNGHLVKPVDYAAVTKLLDSLPSEPEDLTER